MKPCDCRKFFSQGVELQNELQEYALLSGQPNRVITNKTTLAGIGSTSIRANAARVGLILVAQFSPPIAGLIDANFQLTAPDNTNFIIGQIIYKQADVAAVSPSPIVYKPYYWTIKQIGFIITGLLTITVAGGSTVIAVESIMAPPNEVKYTGMTGSEYPQRMFDPKSNEPLER